MLNFYISLLNFSRCCQIPFYLVTADLNCNIANLARAVHRRRSIFGAQIDVTHVWQTLENFGSELVKIWQNLTKFDRVTSKFSNRSFPQYNLDGPKSCQILSNFFWCLSNFYMSFLIFSRCCQIPVLAFNVRFELQMKLLAQEYVCTLQHVRKIALQSLLLKDFGAQNAVTNLWRIMEKFGECYVKSWQNLTEFNKVPSEFNNSIFTERYMDSVKFC